MRLGHEADGVVQRRVTGREPGRIQHVGDAVVGGVLDRVHVRAGWPAPVLHVLVDRRHHLVAQERAQRGAELVRLGVDQRHGVLVVGSVGGVGVDHHVRVPIGKETVEDLRRQAVAFHEIAVQVEVAAIGPEPEGLGPELVHARAGVAVQATIDVVHRDEQEHGGAQRREALRLGAEIAHQRHAAVDALGLTGVDAVVVEEHTTPVGLESLTVEHAVRRDEAGVQRHAVVRLANLGKTQHRREVGCKSFVPRDAVGPAGGLVAIAAFEGGEVGVCVHWM